MLFPLNRKGKAFSERLTVSHGWPPQLQGRLEEPVLRWAQSHSKQAQDSFSKEEEMGNRYVVASCSSYLLLC